MKSICLLGSSSGRNAGDAALIGAITSDVDQRLGRRMRYEIPTINADYVTRAYPNDTVPISMLPWHGSLKMLGWPTFRSIMRSDLVLIFDAVLFDRALFNPLFNYMSTLYLLLPYARRKGIKMGMYNVGTGPVDTKLGKKMLKDISTLMDFITVRDEESAEILRQVGVRSEAIEVAADAALNSPYSSKEEAAAILKSCGINPGREFIAVNINKYLDSWAGTDSRGLSRDEFLSVYARALDLAFDRLQVPYLFTCTQHMDVDIATSLSEKLAPERHFGVLSNRDLNHEQVKAVLGEASLLVGMRLHSIILAAAMCTPVIGLEYQPKVRYFLNNVGLPEYNLRFRDFAPDSLAALIATAWAERASTRRRLEERLPRMQKQARRASEHVARLSGMG